MISLDIKPEYNLPPDRYHRRPHDLAKVNLDSPLMALKIRTELKGRKFLAWSSEIPGGERRFGRNYFDEIIVPESYRPGLKIAAYSWGDCHPDDNQKGVLHLGSDKPGIEGMALFRTSFHYQKGLPFLRDLVAFVTLDDLRENTGRVWRATGYDPSGILLLTAISEGQDWFEHADRKAGMGKYLIPKEQPPLRLDQINRDAWEPDFTELFKYYTGVYEGPTSRFLRWRNYIGDDEKGYLPFTRLFIPNRLSEAFLVGLYSWGRQFPQDSQNVWFGENGLDRLGTELSYTPNSHQPHRRDTVALFDEASFAKIGEIWIAQSTHGQHAGEAIINAGQEGSDRMEFVNQGRAADLEDRSSLTGDHLFIPNKP